MPLILLAEDESSTIDHVRSALSSQGWLVKTVGDRDQALRAASEFAPQLVLVNDRLAGAQDLIRTFSRRSGGPGVILLSTDDGEIQAAATSPDVEAILAKPLDTSDLIETIRQGLVDGGSKPPALPVADTKQVFSSEEIFGDLLDDILDPEVEIEPEAVTSSPEPIAQKPVVDDVPVIETKPKPKPEPRVEKPVVDDAPVVKTRPKPKPEPRVEKPVLAAEPEKRAEPVIDIAIDADIGDVPEPMLEETPATSTAADADEAGGLPVAGLEDLEEVVREGVEAWADSIDPDDTEESDSDTLAEALPKSEPEPEPEPELEEDLESKLEDTLAGVLAASLSQVDSEADSTATASQSVDDLLSQALGDLNLGAIGTAPTDDEVMESTIDDEIQALAASVEFESIAEIGETDLVAEEPEPVDTETEIEVSEDAEKAVEKASEETLEAAAESVEEEVEPLDEIAASPEVATTGVEFGEYTLEQQIGVGGMASVWKARRKGVEGFEKRVAIKKILPQAAENEDFVEMFIDEAKLAAQLNHSNITHIYDLGKIDDDYFIAMEYVEGRNLLPTILDFLWGEEIHHGFDAQGAKLLHIFVGQTRQLSRPVNRSGPNLAPVPSSHSRLYRGSLVGPVAQ